MESQQPPQQQDQQQQPNPNEDGGGGSGSSKSNFLCSRQSSTRWTPTTDQIRILKDLYYNNGVRSPSADQIQRISARLRQYGKIEGKNVFYWFQNHKARERQKKRFSTEIPMQRSVANGCWRSDDPIYNNKFPIITPIPGIPSPSSSSSSSPGMIAVGQMSNYGYGSVTMERNFRHCSISAGCSGGGSIGHNFWDGADPYLPSYPFFDKRKAREEIPEEEQEEQRAPEIETLPLFPMHGEEISGFCHIKPESNSHHIGWYHTDDGNANSRTSLELSLNSYAARPSDST